ncbi:MAG: ECF transporter S component [Chloroflexi bacterium HGW-Chloroflexi-8]|nr:MAG: ECF transporter S component [Chloroflexi bacterium HGW-Chloroflexi-8]
MKEKALNALIYILVTFLGIFAYLYPLLSLGSQNQNLSTTARTNDLPLMMAVLLALCILVIIFEIQEMRLSTKLIALLGVLIAMNSVLRFIDLTLPILGGFSPVFFLIMITGYVFGGRLGFLMGALTMLISALVTGGVGPWLPNQMFTAGWVGMSAVTIRRLVVWTNQENKPAEIWLLIILGVIWGFLYGAITNLWFWPFLSGPGNQVFNPGNSLLVSLRNYGIYYLATSLLWDTGRAIGNAVLIFFFGKATLKVLRRFQKRFYFVHYDSPIRKETI